MRSDRKSARQVRPATDSERQRAAGPGRPLLDALAPHRRWRMPDAHSASARRVRVLPRGSAGHTDATYEELTGAVDAGLRTGTHLYNAMSPLEHRTPGAVGALLSDRRT